MTRRRVVLLVCLCLLVSGVASSETLLSTRLQSFVSNVYQDYAAESFEAVYAVMHPEIKKVISEEEYAAFQEDHFARLSLQLRDIEVGEVSENPRLARSLRQLLPEDESPYLYGVEISYTARFVRGARFNQDVTKTVYIALVNPGAADESIYLLWDPSSMEEEEPGHESD